jgi:hypothetical protein
MADYFLFFNLFTELQESDEDPSHIMDIVFSLGLPEFTNSEVHKFHCHLHHH